MILLLLSSLFPSLGEGSCLRCWPDLLPLVQYDLEILWGSRQPPLYLSTCLRMLLLKKNVPVNPPFLDRAHLEEETALFFNHLHVAIKEWRSDKTRLLNKIQIHGRIFLQGLQRAAQELKNKACSPSCVPGPPVEVANCISCKKYYVTCNDAVLCKDTQLPQTLWIGSSIIFILCVFVSTFGSGLYYFWWRPLQIEKDFGELNGPAPGPTLAPLPAQSPPSPPPPPPTPLPHSPLSSQLSVTKRAPPLEPTESLIIIPVKKLSSQLLSSQSGEEMTREEEKK
ncbi:testis-expressed protein 51 [Sarcophilus harrisii]|uniref:testis-expressed protein 51 n=1 Tax=Sarcophilus harrisii TaxID=9305 RepID=UPI0013020968|nr:testis-expressed protein 51 [Sarcophilus harrisii]